MGRQRKNLLADDEEDVVDLKLAVNKEFASRFEHNAQRARWDRIKSTNPRLAAKIEAKASRGAQGDEESIDSESSSDYEEEDDGEEALRANQQFLSVLSKIKNRDESIYNSEAKLFPDEASEETSDGEAPAAKEKPALLKDVLAQQALMGEESTSDEEKDHRPAGPTYLEEQELYRRSFLQEADKALAAEGEDDDEFGGVLKKQKGRAAIEDVGTAEDAHVEEYKTQELLDAYFGKDNQLADDERFLKHYMLTKGWVDKGEEAQPDLDEIEEDEEYLEQAEKFEARYNHRFEEPGAGNVITYPRDLEGILRKTDTRRRSAREARAERKAAEAAALEAEVKRRKAEKRRELQHRLDKIKDVSGGDVANKMLMKVLGKDDFDMEEYDRAMAAAFDDSYYEAEDEELPEPANEDGSDAAKEPDLANIPEIDGFEDVGEPKLEGETAELAQMVEEYHKLDAEDYVGGVPTRFRYREVPAATYGLNILEVLAAPEKELNQVVGMKKLAPYREDGGLVRPNYAKLRQMQEEAETAAQRKKQRGDKGQRPPKPKAEEQKPSSHAQEGAMPSARERESVPLAPKQLKKNKKKEPVAAEAAGSVKPVSTGKRQRSETAEPGAADEGRTEGKKQRHSSQAHPALGAAASEELPQPPISADGYSKQAAATKQESRLATFAKPTLAKPEKKNRKRTKEQQQPQAMPEQGVQLTKAQRKNLWRQKRRALVKQQQGPE
ncbi:g63 [Coccomyxa elongata]